MLANNRGTAESGRHGQTQYTESRIRDVRHCSLDHDPQAAAMSWLTVLRMMQEKGGFRSPEDLRKTPLNPEPDAKQLQPNERVERIRRIHLNDLENLPFFLIAGLLFAD